MSCSFLPRPSMCTTTSAISCLNFLSNFVSSCVEFSAFVLYAKMCLLQNCDWSWINNTIRRSHVKGTETMYRARQRRVLSPDRRCANFGATNTKMVCYIIRFYGQLQLGHSVSSEPMPPGRQSQNLIKLAVGVGQTSMGNRAKF